MGGVSMVAVIFPAAGKGKRMGAGQNKVFLELLGTSILIRSLLKFSCLAEVGFLIVVVGKEEVAETERLLSREKGLKPWRVVAGGTERQYSIANGLALLPKDADIVLVHDAARPLVTAETIKAVIDKAREACGAIAAVPSKNTIKVVSTGGMVEETPARKNLWVVQTPQGFPREMLIKAYRKAAEDNFLGTDDASLVERLGVPVAVVMSTYENIKITTPGDMLLAKAVLCEADTRGF